MIPRGMHKGYNQLQEMAPASFKKVRILHLVQSFLIGGAEVLLVHYIRALGTEQYDHFVVNVWQDGPMRSRVEEMKVPVSSMPRQGSIKNPFRFLLWLMGLLCSLRRFVSRNGIHVIRSDVGFANQVALLLGALTGVPTFPTVHSTKSFVDRRSRHDLRRRLNRGLDSILYPLATEIICVSEEVRSVVMDRFKLPKSKTAVVKNGIVLEEKPGAGEKDFTERNTYDSGIIILAVGSLDHEKAFEVLIKAVAEVVRRGCGNVILLIAGEGRERTTLEREIRAQNIERHVTLLGHRADVMQLMRKADIFVIPSRYEGLSIAMIEAMASGLPVIASDGPGLKDHVKDEKNGLVFPVDCHDTLAERIIRLVNDEHLRLQLAVAARSTFEREFDLSKNIRTMDLLFQSCARTC